LGKVLRFNNQVDLKVTGILDELPGPSHVDVDFLASMATLPQTGLPRANFDFQQNWILNWFFTYVLLENPEDAAALEQKLVAFAQSNYTPLHLQNQVKLYVQPVRNIHLRTNFGIDLSPSSDIRYIYIFGVIGALVLAIACFNFINLTIAQFSQRLRELGVRKVLGAFRRQLTLQLLLEATLLTVLAGIIALFLVEWSQDIFRNLTGFSVNASYAWPYVFIFAPILSMAAGLYPALVFSSFKPTAALKDATRSFIKGAGLRKVLVVFQFAISVALIIGTLLVHQQLQFMRGKDTGFDRHQMLMVPVRGSGVESQFQAFKDRLLQNPNVVQVSGVNGKLGQEIRYTTFQVEGIATPQILTILRVELDFIKTFGIQLVAGRAFSNEIPTDAKEAFMINEAAMRQFGWSEALGKKLKLVTMPGAPQGTIIGVVKDFHFLPLHKDIGALVIYPGNYSYAAIKVREQRLPETLAFAESVWKEFEADKGFVYSFLDDILAQNYQTEDRVSQLTKYFSGLAIFIACLGLLGLASFTAARRTKEIGIRKVLGASVSSLIGLLSQDFLRLLLIANLIAWPLAYFAMAKWLGNFAYRIDIGWGAFALSGGLALLIALLTVSTQAIKAALGNPVEALRYE
jgi:putative ABC transport system permease protein